MDKQNHLTKRLSDLGINNIFLYVGDAVRFDFLSPKIAQEGITLKTIAAATHSSKSFASLVTGLYPPRHGVESFSNRIPEEVPSVLNTDEVNTTFLNSINEFGTEDHGQKFDPIYSVLNMEEPNISTPFSNVEPPFFVMERGPGGHAAYGDFEGTATEYFTNLGSSNKDQIQKDYQRSIKLDSKHFLNRLDTLNDLGYTHDTLVIYTSDHGEMLGEEGLLGHNGPMCSELVYVPTVFIHPALSDSDIINSTFHHTDIAPTVCDLLETCDDILSGADGDSVIEGLSNSPRPSFWSTQFFSTEMPFINGKLSYEGVWDSSGGHVFSNNSLLSRLFVFGGKLIKSSKRSYMRNHINQGIQRYLPSEQTYGRPGFDKSTARDVLELSKRESINSEEIILGDEAQSTLQDLGYLE